jgi:hypothetical protein
MMVADKCGAVVSKGSLKSWLGSTSQHTIDVYLVRKPHCLWTAQNALPKCHARLPVAFALQTIEFSSPFSSTRTNRSGGTVKALHSPQMIDWLFEHSHRFEALPK